MSALDTASTAPLAGRHALVTGASRGIGLAIAATLAGMGARVTLVGRDAARLAQAAATVAGAAVTVCDVTDATASRTAFDQAVARSGPVSVLVNNAGQALSRPLARTGDDDWERMLAVNLTATFRWTRMAVPAMTADGWGRVVHVASTAGLRGYAYVAAYCAAKHGVVGLTRALALELATTGVTVNAVCPGYTDTDIVAEAVANIVRKTGRSEVQALAELTRFNPQGRLVTPREVADAVAWLCLPGSAAITGQSIAVAGGEVT